MLPTDKLLKLLMLQKSAENKIEAAKQAGNINFGDMVATDEEYDLVMSLLGEEVSQILGVFGVTLAPEYVEKLGGSAKSMVGDVSQATTSVKAFIESF